MTIPNTTLQAIIQAYNGFALSDEEIERLRPELETYLQEVEQLRALDLSNVLSGRLLRAQEGGQA
jgi:Asp-tRNA(Asn)/Glu-tRNA(Gln) amidotransferase C subunit